MSDNGGMTLAELIQARRSGRSYENLAHDSGNRPKLSAWQQWGNGSPRTLLPEPDSIRGIALALGVSHTDVLLAAARSVGLVVAADDPSELRIAGAGLLPEFAQDTLLMMARTLALVAQPEPVDSP